MRRHRERQNEVAPGHTPQALMAWQAGREAGRKRGRQEERQQAGREAGRKRGREADEGLRNNASPSWRAACR